MSSNGADPVLVHQTAFEGPLDLLYYLIRKHELEISEISLATIADEFVAHVEAAAEPNLATAGGFLVTASTLMYLKSKHLLPPEEEAATDPDQEGRVGPLLSQLVDYEKLREVMRDLATAEDRSRASFPRPLTQELERRLERIAERDPFVDMSAFEILKAMRRVQEFAFPVVREVVKQEINLEEKIEELFAIVRVRLKASLTQLIGRSRSAMEGVVFFLAALELARQKALRIRQQETFGEIELTLRTEGPAGPFPR